jgi:hypothetical protein
MASSPSASRDAAKCARHLAPQLSGEATTRFSWPRRVASRAATHPHQLLRLHGGARAALARKLQARRFRQLHPHNLGEHSRIDGSIGDPISPVEPSVLRPGGASTQGLRRPPRGFPTP